MSGDAPEPAGCLDVYECIPRGQWLGLTRDEAGATLHIDAHGQEAGTEV